MADDELPPVPLAMGRLQGADTEAPPRPSSAAVVARARRGLRSVLATIVLLLGCTPAAPPSAAAAAAEGEGSVAGAFLAGRFALGQGDLAAAAQGLGRALEALPDDRDLRYQVMVLQAASGAIDAAAATARGLVEADPEGQDGEARLVLAVVALAAAEPDAEAELRRLGDDTIAGLARPLLQAWAAPEPAAAAAELAASEGRLGQLVALHRVALLDAADRPEEALAVIAEQAREPAASSDRLLVAQARLLARVGETSAATAMLRLGRAPGERSDLVAAALADLEAGRVPPPLIAGATEGMADALLGIGEVLNAQQRPLIATFYTRLALHLAPSYEPTWLALAGLLRQQEGPAAAARALAQIPEGSVWSRSARIEIAELRAAAGDVDAGVAMLRSLVAATADDPGPAIALGDMLRRAERFEEAAAAYATALARSAGDNAPSWRLHYARGIALERSSRWPEAEAALRRALELEPNQPFVLNYLGYSWVDQGLHLEEAKAMLHRAVELRPDDGFIVDSLGWAYYRVGEFAKAVTYLERAVELEPGDPVINDHLGDAYWRVGRLREARFQWERALTLDPQPNEVPGIEAKLRRGLPASDAG